MNQNKSIASTAKELDLGVAERQAFGASYEKPKNHQKLLDAYWAGKLILPPQPVWKGDPTDWTADPFGDRNWRFQHHTLRWLNPLRWSALNGDQKSKREWLRIVSSWATSNIPASKSGSDFAWKDMADGNRAIQLSLGAPLINLDKDNWFVDALRYHRDWLADPAHIVTNNHALHQHCGLLVVSATLNDSEGLQLAVARMSELFELTFDAEGANDEGSVNYHQLNMVWWTQAWKRAANENLTIPFNVSERLRAAAEVLAHLSMPNAELPQIGDGARSTLRMGLGDASDFVASDGKSGKSPQSTSLVLKRGYAVSRGGWGEARPLADESHMLLRFGEALHPRVHSHYDRGSVHIYSEGSPWLIDSGFHSYQPSAPENQYLLSREAHNLVSIPSEAHNKDAPVELVTSNITEAFHEFKVKDHGYQDHDLTRRVVYLVEPNCWIISDEVQSKKGLQLKQRWFVEPNTLIRHLDNGFRLDKTSSSFSMRWLGRRFNTQLKSSDDTSFVGWIGTKWRTLVPSNAISVETDVGQHHIATLLSPNTSIPLAIIESHVATSGHIRLHVARGPRYWNINISKDDIQVRGF